MAQVSLGSGSSKANEFTVVSSKANARLFFDEHDFEVVKKVADLFSNDVRMITGKAIQVGTTKDKLASNSIIVGTLGHNELINKLVAKNKLDVSSLKNRWESYLIEIVCNPLPGVGKALVVVGSDRRGTAYGLFSISEAMGISPWYWWADAPVVKRQELSLKVDRIIAKEPTVKYRGIFINDEDWGLLRWAKRTFEKERGNIGPKTYAKVCELLLRLKANYLCPAMHEASTAFNKISENKLVADSFAIVMGSVHCEPLLFNNASEWDKKTMGEWDYVNNKATLNKVLRQRVTENSPFENVYTLALRGLHDKAMGGSNNMKERVKMLGAALRDQRQLLVDVIKRPADEIPQAFTPYKEVLDVYSAGLDLPEDVTIIWPDDNYGYMKRLSSPREQKRSGRAGVYYHVSYLGKPHDYLWMSTTPPALMYEELRKAYDTTADRIWLLNVGDIKSCEFSMNLFLAMAYDIDSFNYDNISLYQARWLSNMFGDKYYDDFVEITNTFYHQSFSRKPEFMGWGYQWSTNRHGKERNTDTDFSFANYQEADLRLAAYDRIGTKVERILNELPEEQKAGFYQLLYYPVKGCELLNKMVLNGQKNRWYALQQRSAANELKNQVKVYSDSLQTITEEYNSLLGGKWNHIMTTRQGFAASYFELPKLETVSLPDAPSLGIWVEGEDVLKGKSSFYMLPAFNTYLRQSHFFDVFNKGKGKLNWNIKVSETWIQVNKDKGSTAIEDRIWVSIDWTKVPVGDRVSGVIEVVVDGMKQEKIYVSVFNPTSPSLTEIDTLFVEHNGYVSISAADYHRKVENDVIKIMTIPNLGFENAAVQLGNPIAPMQRTGSSIVPRVEYDFYTFEQGAVDVYTYVLPTFTLSADKDYAGHEATNIETRYGVCIDDGPVMNPSTSSFEYAQIWYESVLKNCRINKTTLHINKPGKHTVKVLCGDAGTVLQKIVLDFGGMKRSYLGPRPTKLK
ncbi:glycosyl hydrolase 115 family protein [Bacteroides zhangwenhongii]|uniref:Glycosyl hydrolase 115 family protein n=2 Tax=Bacteroides zhangwenhongii TaxID=2650157 RepID=A0ABT5H428_9BACE|nr:glycosyl hydrolase 115 family protein [Bacteroides zhangwenhongii]MDC7135348.1 glycosyl hydrolase 115 family protein [Bacteroides zhangwenhongii]